VSSHVTFVGQKLLELTELRYDILPMLIQSTQLSETTTYGDSATSRALSLGDPVSRIVKCHLLSEVILDKLLLLALAPNGEAVLAASLRYSQKLAIASRCKLTEDIELLPDFVVGSLGKLNRMRNRLAHEFNATVTREDVIALFMGIDHPMPCNLATAAIELLIYHYAPFIFGNMLPKYELADPNT